MSPIFYPSTVFLCSFLSYVAFASIAEGLSAIWAMSSEDFGKFEGKLFSFSFYALEHSLTRFIVVPPYRSYRQALISALLRRFRDSPACFPLFLLVLSLSPQIYVTYISLPPLVTRTIPVLLLPILPCGLSLSLSLDSLSPLPCVQMIFASLSLSFYEFLTALSLFLRCLWPCALRDSRREEQPTRTLAMISLSKLQCLLHDVLELPGLSSRSRCPRVLTRTHVISALALLAKLSSIVSDTRLISCDRLE